MVLAVTLLGQTTAVFGATLSALGITFVGSSLLIGAAGLLSAASVALARQRLLRLDHRLSGALESDGGTTQRHADVHSVADGIAAPSSALYDAAWIATWPQTLFTAICALLAATGVALGWSTTSGPAVASTSQFAVAGVLVLAAFPILVLERVFADADRKVLLEAPELASLLRVPLIALVGTGVTNALAAFGFRWAIYANWVIGAAILTISLELLARATATLFLPSPPPDQPRYLAHSTLASLLRLVPELPPMGELIEQQLGISLSRSWAIEFLRRAVLPAMVALAAGAWLLTGVTALPLDQRAVYERFGVPVAVLGPGLHLHLPWPAGRIRRAEFGVLHKIAVTQPTAVRAAPTQTDSPGKNNILQMGAEDLPPPAVDRLWDQSHASEATYLVASASGGRQSFQIVNVDLRLVYRVGLSDEAARMAAYQIAEPEQLVHAATGRILAHYFASRTLLGILDEDREKFTTELRAELQHELDGLSSGLDLVAIIIEAIHPPPGAARAYHDVQAAEIRARTAIADQRGGAARSAGLAEQTALEERNGAAIKAAEAVARAQAQGRLFEGDRLAYQEGGSAFLLERRFDKLQHGLAHGQLIIIDHRLSGQDAPTLDLRNLAPSTAPTP
jgi:regulator of protease activity HflC (stomatin/prohibitin superfamily)